SPQLRQPKRFVELFLRRDCDGEQAIRQLGVRVRLRYVESQLRFSGGETDLGGPPTRPRDSRLGLQPPARECRPGEGKPPVVRVLAAEPDLAEIEVAEAAAGGTSEPGLDRGQPGGQRAAGAGNEGSLTDRWRRLDRPSTQALELAGEGSRV